MNGSLASISLQLIYIFTSITVSDIVDIVLVAAVFFCSISGTARNTRFTVAARGSNNCCAWRTASDNIAPEYFRLVGSWIVDWWGNCSTPFILR